MATELLAQLFSATGIPSDEDASSSSSSESEPRLSRMSPSRRRQDSHRKEGRGRRYSKGSHRDNMDGKEERSSIERHDRRSRSRRQNRRSSKSGTPNRRRKKETKTTPTYKERSVPKPPLDVQRDDDRIMSQIEFIAPEHTYCHDAEDFDEGMEVSVLTLPTVLQSISDGGGGGGANRPRASASPSPMLPAPSFAAMPPKIHENSPSRKFASLHEENKEGLNQEQGDNEMENHMAISSAHLNEYNNDGGAARIAYGHHQWPCDPTSSDCEPGQIVSKVEADSEAIDEPPALGSIHQQYSPSLMDLQSQPGGEEAGPGSVGEPPALDTIHQQYPPTMMGAQYKREEEEVVPELSVGEPPALRMVQQYPHQPYEEPQLQMEQGEAGPLELVCGAPVLAATQQFSQQSLDDEPPSLRTVPQQFTQTPEEEPPLLRKTHDQFSQPPENELPTLSTAPQHFSQPPEDAPPALTTTQQQHLQIQPEITKKQIGGEKDIERTDTTPAVVRSSYTSFSSISINNDEVEMSLSQPPVLLTEKKPIETTAMAPANIDNIARKVDHNTAPRVVNQNRFVMPAVSEDIPKTPSTKSWPSMKTTTPKPVVIQSWASEDTEDHSMFLSPSPAPSAISLESLPSDERNVKMPLQCNEPNSEKSSKQQLRRSPLSSLKQKMTKSSSLVHPRKLFSTSQLARLGGSTRLSPKREGVKDESREKKSIITFSVAMGSSDEGKHEVQPTMRIKDGLPSPPSDLGMKYNRSASCSPIGVALVPNEYSPGETDQCGSDTPTSTSLTPVIYNNDSKMYRHSKIEENRHNEDDMANASIVPALQYSRDDSSESGPDRDMTEEGGGENNSSLEGSCATYFSRQIDDAMTKLWSAEVDSDEDHDSIDDTFDELMCTSDKQSTTQGNNNLVEKEIIHELISHRSPTSVSMFDDLTPDDEISQDNVDIESEIFSDSNSDGCGSLNKELKSRASLSVPGVKEPAPDPTSYSDATSMVSELEMGSKMECEDIAGPASAPSLADAMASANNWSDPETQISDQMPNIEKSRRGLMVLSELPSDAMDGCKDLTLHSSVSGLSDVMASTTMTDNEPSSHHYSEEDAMLMSDTASDLMDSVAFSEPKFTLSYASKDNSSTDDYIFSVLEENDEAMTKLSEGDEEATASPSPLRILAPALQPDIAGRSLEASSMDPKNDAMVMNESATSLNGGISPLKHLDISSIESRREYCESDVHSSTIRLAGSGEGEALSKARCIQYDETMPSLRNENPEISSQKTLDVTSLADPSAPERNNPSKIDGIEGRIQQRESNVPPISGPSSSSSSYLRRMRLSKGNVRRCWSNRDSLSTFHTTERGNPLCSPSNVSSSPSEHPNEDCLDIHVSSLSLDVADLDNPGEVNDTYSRMDARPSSSQDDDLSGIVASKGLQKHELTGACGEQFLPNKEATSPPNNSTEETTGKGTFNDGNTGGMIRNTKNEEDSGSKPTKTSGMDKQSTQSFKIRLADHLEETPSDVGRKHTSLERKIRSIDIDPNGMVSEKVNSDVRLPVDSVDAGTCGFSTLESLDAAQIIQRVFRGWMSRYHLLCMMGVAKRRKWEHRIKSATLTRIHSDIRRRARASLRERANQKNGQERGHHLKCATCCMAIAVRRVCAIKIQTWWLQKRRYLNDQKENYCTPSDGQDLDDFLEVVSITLIQANVRGYIQRNRNMQKYLSATKIQSFYRSKKCWHDFNKTILPSIVLIQTCVRMFISNKSPKSVQQVQLPHLRADLLGDVRYQESSMALPSENSSITSTIKERDSPTASSYSIVDGSGDEPCGGSIGSSGIARSPILPEDNQFDDEKRWIASDPPLDFMEQSNSTSDVLEDPVSAEDMGYQCVSMPSSLASGFSVGSDSFGSKQSMEVGGSLINSAWDDLQENFRSLEDSGKRSGRSKGFLSKKRGVLGKIKSKLGVSSSSFRSRSSNQNNEDRLVDFFGAGDGLSRPTPPLPDASSISLESSLNEEVEVTRKDFEEKNDLNEELQRKKNLEVSNPSQCDSKHIQNVKDPSFLIMMRADSLREEFF